MARHVRALVKQQDYCTPPVDDFSDLTQRFYDEGLAPTTANYGDWALGPDSLDIGLGQGQIGAEACSTKRIQIPWSSLWAELSPRGRALADLAGQGLGTAPCSGTRLYAAAARKEGLKASDYGTEPSTGPYTEYERCFDGWAEALVNRPHVGSTDGLTLFKASGTDWVEVSELGGDQITYCSYTAHGVPLATAKRFTTYAGEASSGTPC